MLVHIAASDSQSSLDKLSEEQIQPNAIDLKLDRVWASIPSKPFMISEDSKQHREKVELIPNKNGYYRLAPKTSYEVTFEGKVTIGPDEAGFVITRSTLNRNGLFITSGLYDSGYSGAMAGALHNNDDYAFIKKGTRVGQFLLWKAQSLKQYNGSYGLTAEGKVKAEEARYH